MNRNLVGSIYGKSPSFGSFGQVVSEEMNFKISTNQNQALPVAAMFVNGSPSSHISHNLVGRFCIKFLKTEWKVSDTGSVGWASSFFSSPDPKGHVRYCHHLASVVRSSSVIRPLTFHILIYSYPCQISDIINGFWVVTKNVQFYHMFYF
jgi:hypothetical protein